MEHSIFTVDNTLKLSLSGKFTFADNKIFSHLLEEISNQTYKQVVIDLAKVVFIDSAALGLLLLARDKCGKTSTILTLRSPKGQVKRMFVISRFNELFQIEDFT